MSIVRANYGLLDYKEIEHSMDGGLIVKRPSRSQGLLVAGLLLVLVGSLLPLRLPSWTSQRTFEIGSSGVDIPVSILYGEALAISVSFDDSAVPGYCWVRAEIDYQYPTKGVGETAIRLDGQREVDFTFGWANVRLIPLFVTRFLIRLFYWGSETITVNVTISRLTNIAVFAGLGLLVASAFVVMAPVMIDMFGRWRSKEQLMK